MGRLMSQLVVDEKTLGGGSAASSSSSPLASSPPAATMPNADLTAKCSEDEVVMDLITKVNASKSDGRTFLG